MVKHAEMASQDLALRHWCSRIMCAKTSGKLHCELAEEIAEGLISTVSAPCGSKSLLHVLQ